MAVTAEALRELHRIHRQFADLRERFERGPKQVAAREANLTRMGDGTGQDSSRDESGARSRRSETAAAQVR